MAIQFSMKQGDTLTLNGQLLQDSGAAIDITSITITSQIRDNKGNLVGAATVSAPSPTTGQFTLTWQSDATWPIGTLLCDVLYVSSTMTVHSDTFQVRVAPAMTQS